MKNNSGFMIFRILLVLLLLSTSVQAQLGHPMQSSLDSLKRMASKPTLSLSTEEKTILAARIFMIDNFYGFKVFAN